MSKPEGRVNLAQEARAFDNVFNSPDGKIVLAALERNFAGTTLKKDPQGRVDPNASISAAGAREVLLYIDLQRKRANAIT